MIDAKPQQVVAAETTANSVDDASVVPNFPFRRDGKVRTLRGGGDAYDKRKVYKATSERRIQPIIPPVRTFALTMSALGRRTVVIATTPL